MSVDVESLIWYEGIPVDSRERRSFRRKDPTSRSCNVSWGLIAIPLWADSLFLLDRTFDTSIEATNVSKMGRGLELLSENLPRRVQSQTGLPDMSG